MASVAWWRRSTAALGPESVEQSRDARAVRLRIPGLRGTATHPRRLMDYAVANHIYTCATEAGVVVLDSRRGKYSIVPGDRARSLEEVVRGWPVLPPAEAASENQTAASSTLLNSLVRGGIVMPMTDPRLRVCTRTAVSVAQEALLDALAARERPKIRWRHVVTFSLSVTYAIAMLKSRPFEALLHNLRRRKERDASAHAKHSIADIRECVRSFSWLRPLAYAESEACLFDSVVLTDFLIRQGILAEFLIGVRIRPFVAHSWVQIQGFALNDLPEYLAAYTPILSV